MAAGLVAKAARISQEGWAEASGVIVQADSLRRRVSPLAQTDADAYRKALETMRAPAETDPERRDAEIAGALSDAADVPLEIAEVAADVAALGALVAERGNEALRAEAAAGAALAEASARIAALLVEINLAVAPEDERISRAKRLADEAAASARGALRPS
jgi:formiminotetrahydrofolate cyclodeaminase